MATQTRVAAVEEMKSDRLWVYLKGRVKTIF